MEQMNWFRQNTNKKLELEIADSKTVVNQELQQTNSIRTTFQLPIL